MFSLRSSIRLRYLPLALYLVPIADAPAEEPVRALLLYGGHGFPTNAFFETMRSLPGVRIEIDRLPDALQRLKAGLEREFDVIVRYDMFRGTAEHARAVRDLVAGGMGLVALHHAIGAHPDSMDHARLIGGKFLLKAETIDGRQLPKSTYSHGEEVHVRIADRDHPITQGLDDFVIRDETYGGLWIAPDVHVLLTTTHPKASPAIAWVREEGRGRVVYVQLGHDEKAYDHPSFRTLVGRAILWAARREPSR
ncbi:MAG: ThuA domain-containing protein [Kiritimatiellae bacterium]|nr:ThuA domain-containing protein [Kiritimatiellia bacterium]